ncbi:MAG: hypothetical protein IPM53_17105 [Anaerolineaceae bacterium]|nr:hypothetical protein [Anaerolineaceae bacterium]
MSKSPAALHWPKKDKQTISHEQRQEERPLGVNLVRERPLQPPSHPAPTPPSASAKRTLSFFLSKFL